MDNILLDMDGTIVNWTKGMCKAHGKPETDIWLSPEAFRISVKQFWAPCSSINFWRDLEWMPDGLKILSIVEKAGNVYILTKPTLSVSSYSGKMVWIEKHLPEYKRKTIICSCKELLAGNGILIDDVDENVNNFRCSGGKAILIPRPWNSRCGRGYFNLEAEINEAQCKTQTQKRLQ